jgi:hypothetical protein
MPQKAVVLLMMILNEYDIRVWNGIIWLREQWRALLNTPINLWVQ